MTVKNLTTGDVLEVNRTTNRSHIRQDGMVFTIAGVNFFRDTNRKFISLAPGDNQFEITGATEDFKEFVKTFDGNRLIEKNYNLFNKKDIVAGSLVGTTGEVTNPDSGFYTTNFIEVIPGKRLQIKPNQGVTVIYDSNYQYIQQISSAQHPMILPPNARYVRNTMGVNSIDGKYIYLGEEDLPYIEYGYSYTPSFKNLVKEIVTQFDVPRYI